jgi:2-amino-4-hydroxy-6-hydroxymethyldihydropteridine diphosphokinase
MAQTSVAYLSAGSNLGDREGNLENGIRGLLEAGLVVRRISSVYETEPVGFLEQPWFLNIALETETHLSPKELLACCLKVEGRIGRVRSFTGAPRTLDLDILLYGDLIIDQPGLRIPHPRMAQRRFVLEPLAQIAPELLHPELKQDISYLLSTCADPSDVVLHSELTPL